jgi:monofunctional biosynthetic peptidoglycan transglycosylase
VRRTVLQFILSAVAVIVIAPYLIVPFYRFIDPVSTPMIWRWITRARIDREVVPLDRIAPVLPLSVIVAEDGGFCHNIGIDLGAMREAFRAFRMNGQARGASTITQQTVKNLFLWEGRSFVRKALEIPLALWTNLMLPKRRIMEIYLNIVQWGPNGEFGAEAAARWAFGISAAYLDPAQAADLAAVLPNPVERSARNAGPLVRRLAGLYQRRAVEFAAFDECLRHP